MNAAETPGGTAVTADCPRCSRTVETIDHYCRHCGARLGKTETVLYHPLTIFILAFTVLGPFAIPMVWRSTQMSRAAKHGMTWTILFYSTAMVVLAFLLIKMAWDYSTRLGQSIY